MSENLIGATTAVFPIRLSVAVSTTVDVEWATRDGSAVAGSDYKATAGTVTFLPGETEKQIEVQVYGQAITPADDKVFFIRLNPPSNAVLVDAILTCTINIIDDQGTTSVAVVVAEGRRGPKGDPGLSAYEQAVLMGYTGTLAEWMDQIADASKAADRANDHAISAAEDALKAQNAAKNAVFAGVIFPTASEGVDPVLGVKNGAYFNVRSPLSEHYIDEYQNVNGVAVATGKSYPTSDHFQNISEHTPLPFVDGTSYRINRPVVLTNGDIVKSTIDGNTINPNNDMTGWVKTNSASQVFDANGLSQQQINTSNARLTGNVLDYFTKSELEAWQTDQENFDASDAIIRAQVMSKSNEITFPTGTFRLTKQIPSAKSWRGVRGSFQTRGTKVVVDSTTPITPLIVQTFGGIEVNDIYFTGKQVNTHTIYEDNGYTCIHGGLRVEKFAVGFDINGTYDYFEGCEFVGNGVGVKSRAVKKSIEGSEYTQSTMFGFNRCFFLYNDIGFDASPSYGVGVDEDLINIPFIECGFELNNIGINSPQRSWYMTLLNSWFEANTIWGLNAPTSHVIEINTRHNANSPKNVDPENHTQILGMVAKFVEMTIQNNLSFASKYLANGSIAQNGGALSQSFTDDAGAAKAQIRFVREAASGISGGAGMVFSTTTTSSGVGMVDRWNLSRYGNLLPVIDNGYDIGSPSKRVGSIYAAKIMYSATVGDFYGLSSPEGVVTANPGSTYRRTDGSTPCFYVKESGLAATGWVAK